MKVFVTGASGFIGSAVVKELLAAGHRVTGLARSEESARIISDAGAQVLRGSLTDLDSLRQGALQADGIIHTAFIHDFVLDFSQYFKAAEADKAAIEAMGEAIKGTDKPIVVTGGTLGLPQTNGYVTEADTAPADSPRASESAAMLLAEGGIKASVVRLPPCVHGHSERGFMAGFASVLMAIAKQKGVSAYVGNGSNRWPAVHRLDAAHLFRLALEKAGEGARYNGIGDEGLTIHAIADAIGKKLNLPVASIPQEEAMPHFGWMGGTIVLDVPATSYETQKQLGWEPTHSGLIEDILQTDF